MKTKKKTAKSKAKKQPKLYLVVYSDWVATKVIHSIYLDAVAIKKLGLLKRPSVLFINGKIIDAAKIK